MSISNYIHDLAIVAVVTGIICCLGDKLQGGIGKFVSIACSIVIAFYGLYPFTEYVKSQPPLTIEGTVPAPTVWNEDEYYNLIEKTTVENLKQTAYGEIYEKLGIEGTEYDLEFSCEILNDKFMLKKCYVVLKTVNAVSKRELINEYIKINYGCECEFREDII